MLTREQVLLHLVNDGAMEANGTIMHRGPYGWLVKPWDGIPTHFCDTMDAVDNFISCQARRVDFPDARELKELYKREEEAKYNQWCEEHEEILQTAIAQIYIAQMLHKRTIEFDVPLKEAEGRFRRYFTEKHYNVNIEPYDSDRTDKRGLVCCKLAW